MIAYLHGVIREKNFESVVIDVNGVGYGVKVTIDEAVSLKEGDKTKLFIYEHIREDTHDLYGFSEPLNRQLFELLLSVKNVGPRVALAVMSLGSESVVRGAIAGGDVKLLQSAKHVGKRAAEQIVVELRDRVGLESSEDAENIVSRGGVRVDDEAMQALLALGFNNAEASKALSGIDKELPVEDKVKQALRAKK
ncbi:Holliday junction branch migration protein RuvA [Candidatus Saccharibacteria bacterium]|nr:Holliday junction branch migration protein RuvA [Candidatus Saccharibacteria bacterium]